jgi:phospholipase/carboxylesterase
MKDELRKMKMKVHAPMLAPPRTYFATNVVPKLGLHSIEIFVNVVTGYSLPFLERTPREAVATSPLLILLHGRAAEAKTIFSIEGLLDPRFYIIAIRGTYESEIGGYEWFHPDKARSDEINDAERFDESENLLTKEIQEHIDRISVDPNNLFLWGFSQGAAMSLILGLRGIIHPKGVVPMSGFLPSPVRQWERWNTKGEYLLVHGTNDEVLPVTTSLDAKDFLESKGIHATYHEYRGRHKMTLDSIAFINQWILQQASPV